jgi:alpha-glucosidase
MEETSRTGVPLMEPIFLEYPDAQNLYGEDHQFLFGRDLFVAPVVTDKVDAEDVHLPPGDWYDFWTAQMHSSKDQISLHPAIAETPFYVRAGAIIPMQPVVQSTNEKPDGSLELRVYMGEDCHGTLYQDDGLTFAYQKGDFLRVNFTCDVSPHAMTVTSSIEKNAYKPWWNSTRLEIYGAGAEPKEVRVGDQLIHDWRFDAQAHCITLTVPDALKNWNVRLTF